MEIAIAKTAGEAAVDIELSTAARNTTQECIDREYVITAVTISVADPRSPERFKIRYTAFDAALSGDVFAALRDATDGKVTNRNTTLADIDTQIKAAGVAIQP